METIDLRTMPQTSLGSTGLSGGGNGSGRACLVRIYPPSIGEGVLPLSHARFLIGRGTECELELSESDISRQHASIEFDAKKNAYSIRDLKSLNGTHVNGRRIDQHVLRSGDLLQIGHTVLKFLGGDGIERKYHEAIYTMTITDGLTGVANKRYLLEALERELVRSQRHQRPFSVAMFDIDHFKQVNDTHGHLAGDAVLRQLCDRIKVIVRKDELLARYGGEEFAVLLPESTSDEAATFGERIRESVASEPFAIETFTIPVTVSVGIATTTGDTDTTVTDLLAQADEKLYEAKNAGRNTVRY